MFRLLLFIYNKIFFTLFPFNDTCHTTNTKEKQKEKRNKMSEKRFYAIDGSWMRDNRNQFKR